MQHKLDLDKIDNSEDCISAYDGELNIVIWNKRLAARYNIPASRAIGAYVLDLFPQVTNDFRIKCLRQAFAEKKTFFFSNLPYSFENAIYTQLITPVTCRTIGYCAVSIVRDHREGEIVTRADLLNAIN